MHCVHTHTTHAVANDSSAAYAYIFKIIFYALSLVWHIKCVKHAEHRAAHK